MEKRRTDKRKYLRPANAAAGTVRLYQAAVSPLLRPCCRFHPSCSEYFIQSLLSRGFVKGSLAGVYRILRCNPLNPGGYDPVNAE